MMPTTFLSLPFELRQEIYDLALTNTVVTVTLDIVQKTRLTSHCPFFLQAYQVDNRWLSPYPAIAVPATSDLRQQLTTRKHAISLLKVSRRVHADLISSISGLRFHIKLRTNLDNFWAYDPEYDYSRCLTEVMNTPVLRSLLHKVGSISWPWSPTEPWVDFFSDQTMSTLTGLHTIVLYDGSAAGRHSGTVPYSGLLPQNVRTDVIHRAKRNAETLRHIPRLRGIKLKLCLDCGDEVTLPQTIHLKRRLIFHRFSKARWLVQTSMIYSILSAHL